MILTGPAIRAHLAAGTITITPLTDEPGDSQVDQAGVTLHLHPRLLECWTRKAAGTMWLSRDPGRRRFRAGAMARPPWARCCANT